MTGIDNTAKCIWSKINRNVAIYGIEIDNLTILVPSHWAQSIF